MHTRNVKNWALASSHRSRASDYLARARATYELNYSCNLQTKHETRNRETKAKPNRENVKLSPKWLALRSVQDIMDQLPYRLHRVDSLFIIYYYCCYYLVLFDFSSLVYCIVWTRAIVYRCWEPKPNRRCSNYKPYLKQSESLTLASANSYNFGTRRIETINKNYDKLYYMVAVSTATLTENWNNRRIYQIKKYSPFFYFTRM